jgi:predicted Ser/Thr protein kinase
MARAGLDPGAGGGVAEVWNVHCPGCGADVAVPAGSEAVACPGCHAAFVPGATDTAAWTADSGLLKRDPEDELVGRTVGGWRVLRRLGRGGMGRVYEATDAAGRRRVALKVLAEELAADASFVRRFRREAKVLSSLSHPHVVDVIAEGEDGGRLYFVMEYVRGENLRRRMARGPIPVADVVRIAAEVASALAYAHEHGVVHRDLKPENVLLDEEGRVHLADFGLSRLQKDAPEATTMLTRTDVILGTYEYMAPEQRRGDREVDARADIYALGVMVYEMLTGSLPLGRFQPASRARPEVPEALDAVVNQALATDPGDRWQGAPALRDALLLAGRPSAAPARPRPPEPPRPADLEAARGILRHVDILVALDRVAAVLGLLMGFGVLSVATLKNVAWPIFAVGGPLSVVMIVAGFLLLGQATRLSRMNPEARTAQVTWSIVFLFFPPLFTAVGVYGLVVLTSRRALDAFAVGRKRLERGATPVIVERVVEVVREPARLPPWILLRVLLVAALLWTVYVGVLATSGSRRLGLYDELRAAHLTSVVGVVLSLVAVVLAHRVRRVRRGVGVAFAALLLFGADAAILARTPVERRAELGAARADRARWPSEIPLTLERQR